MQHNSRRRKTEACPLSKVSPSRLLSLSSSSSLLSFLGGVLSSLLWRQVSPPAATRTLLVVSCPGASFLFFSYLIKKSSLNVLYFIQFVQIYSTSVSPRLQQEEEEEGERGFLLHRCKVTRDGCGHLGRERCKSFF